MGFGLNVKVEAPKIEVPKVEVPKVDVAAAVSGAANSAMGAVSNAVDSAKNAVSSAVTAAANTVTAAAATVVETATASIESVAGAIADVAVSFTGAIDDIVLEPHLQLDANASFGQTKFEKGPIRVRIELTREEAAECTDILHLFSSSGEYDEECSVADFADCNENTVVVLFDDAPMDDAVKYSLEVVQEDGDAKVIFSDVAYTNIYKSRDGYLVT